MKMKILKPTFYIKFKWFSSCNKIISNKIIIPYYSVWKFVVVIIKVKQNTKTQPVDRYRIYVQADDTRGYRRTSKIYVMRGTK